MNMEERINVAEILRNCPKGMELDCTIYESVVLDEIKEGIPFPIFIKSTQDGHLPVLINMVVLLMTNHPNVSFSRKVKLLGKDFKDILRMGIY